MYFQTQQLEEEVWYVDSVCTTCKHMCMPVRAYACGCLNYGHSCLGAHGKRASVNPGEERSLTPALQPALPRPLLDLLLDALSSATRPGPQNPSHAHLRQRYPSDLASSRALLLEDVNEPGMRVMADGNEDATPFGYNPNEQQDSEDAVYVFGPVEDYSESRYRRDAGNISSAKDKEGTHVEESTKEEKTEKDLSQDGRRKVKGHATQAGRIVDLHILANWVRR
ncbi:uncharacterized protein LOC122265599 [Penaeus japonicus]|uniref:uncharacterized protein LOC122265599 n=1 Tax=Penaeus japonicus TaxID=27405 RepID=UPI001C70F4E8|nr:uncharacterized protein LOC122265599 [Penaeus japonicus]